MKQTKLIHEILRTLTQWLIYFHYLTGCDQIVSLGLISSINRTVVWLVFLDFPQTAKLVGSSLSPLRGAYGYYKAGSLYGTPRGHLLDINTLHPLKIG